MATSLEELKVLNSAEIAANQLWEIVLAWPSFAKETVGKQLVRSADSIGAKIAESYGRFHYGEKINFLYYARGSLYETRYWVKIATDRQLLSDQEATNLTDSLNKIARQINSFAKSLKSQRQQSKTVRESDPAYWIDAE